MALNSLSQFCSPHSVSSELDALRYFLSKEITTVDGLIKLSDVLGANFMILKKKLQQCKNQDGSLSDMYDLFISEISSVHDIIKSLFFNKHRVLATKLFWCYNDVKPGKMISGVYRITVRNKDDVTSYFIKIKNLVHARVFTNPYEHVKKLGSIVKSKINSCMEAKERQILCDRYIVLKAIEYDAGSNVSRIAKTDDETFLEMEDVIEHTSNPSISRVLLFGRKADALSTLRHFDEGEKMLTEAYVCADTIVSCLEAVDMVYKGVVFKLSNFEQNPTKELQKEIIFDAHRALTLLSQENEEDQRFWKLLLILRMAFALLGIGKQCRVISNYLPDKDDITEAECLLSSIDSNNIDHRKQMFYFMAQARIHELKDQKAWCLYYLQKAMILAITGNYSEKKFINEYGENLGKDLTFLYNYVIDEKPPIHLIPPLNTENQIHLLSVLPDITENIHTDDPHSYFSNIGETLYFGDERHLFQSSTSTSESNGLADSSLSEYTTSESVSSADSSLELSSISSLSFSTDSQETQ